MSQCAYATFAGDTRLSIFRRECSSAMVAAKPARYLNVWRPAVRMPYAPAFPPRDHGPATADVPPTRRAAGGTRGEAGRHPAPTRGVPRDVERARRTTLRGGRVLPPRNPDEGPRLRCGGAGSEGEAPAPRRGRPRDRCVPPASHPVPQPQGGVPRRRARAVPARRAVGPEGGPGIVPLSRGRAGLARAGGRRVLDEGGVPPVAEHWVLGPSRDSGPARPAEPRPPRRDPRR